MCFVVEYKYENILKNIISDCGILQIKYDMTSSTSVV